VLKTTNGDCKIPQSLYGATVYCNTKLVTLLTSCRCSWLFSGCCELWLYYTEYVNARRANSCTRVRVGIASAAFALHSWKRQS